MSQALPDALIGSGLYKLAYVTTDRERAIEQFRDRLGFEEFAPFEPAFEAQMADGRTGQARLRCAFSTGRSNVVELMEPVEGLVDLWAGPLEGANGFAIAFHHIGLLTDDLDAVKASAARHGMQPVLEASIPGVGSFAYLEPPGLGHFVEHIEYEGDGGRFLAGIRAPTEGR